MPRRGSSPSTAFHADGMKAQSAATLKTTLGFSASAAKTGFARTRCSHNVSPSSTNWVGTTTGTSRSRPGATRRPKGLASTKVRHSASPRVASTGAVYTELGDRPRPRTRSCPRRRSELGDRLVAVALVVDLAVGGPADAVDEAHAPRCLVGGQAGLDVVDELGFGRGRDIGVELDHGHDLLAERLVRYPDHDGVAHGVVCLERLLDLLGEDLLAARVDADRAAPEQVDGAVGPDLGEVAGDGVPHAVDGLEGAVGLLRILVVAEGVAAAQRQDPDLVGAGRHFAAAVLGEHLDVGAQGERGRLGRAALAGDRHAHAERLRRA